MLRRTLLQTALAAPLLAACATTAATTAREMPVDTSSHARPNEARVRHVSLDLTADFDRKLFSGKATLDVEAAPGVNEIVLDSDNLQIRGIRAGGRPTTYTVGEHRETFGAPLTIQLNGARRIEIEYDSAPGASALQWLEPAQTASNKRFLFSQGQAIHNRSWIPTQDSPSVRQTYDARITAPGDLKVVMSAEMLTPNGQAAANGMRTYRFRMPQAIPPYLIAIAIGDLVHRDIGPRTGVYAEPSVIERAAYECGEMERMMDVAESLYGPYRWGRYDVLVLPPSFPYGGMENPRLTFLTPTFLAGDRSLTGLIAHELAHSWSGNLVTNAIWNDSWLNEGFTSYIESRISEVLFGEETARMSAVLGWTAIQNTVRTANADLQRLHVPGTRGAEENNSTIVYGKGALFLKTIEQIIGRNQIDSYLRGYFDRYAFQPMTTQWFLADFREHVVRGDAALEARLMLDQWAYEPGVPSNATAPTAEGFNDIPGYIEAFVAGGPPAAAPWEHWNTVQRQRYIQTLPRELPAERLTALEAAFNLDEIGNMEVRYDWLMLAINNRFAPSETAIVHFLTEQGRGKFVRPVYGALMRQGDWGQTIARRTYATARPAYHPIVQAALDRVVTNA